MKLNYRKIEKAFIPNSINALISVNSLKKINKQIEGGYIYTSYREIDHTIKIGFSITMNMIENKKDNYGYTIIDTRLGSIREKRIIKEALKELGYIPKLGHSQYFLTKNLVRHLETLRWPVSMLLHLYKTKQI
tara:strand:+ start:9902 stop:10300 length:399 start_codon:yes stop_codon:yes gene_type:complete